MTMEKNPTATARITSSFTILWAFWPLCPTLSTLNGEDKLFFLFREIKRSTSLSFCLCTHKVTCVYASPRNISKKVYIFFFWLLLSSRAGFVWRYTHNFPQKLRLRLCHVRYFFVLLFPWLFISSFLFGLPVLVVGHIRSVSLSLLIRPSQLVIFTHSNSREPFSRVCALGVASK